MAGRFSIGKFQVVGFDLDMTLCRYRIKPMMNLVYSAIAKYLVNNKRYPSSLLDPISDKEANSMTKGNVIDWNEFKIHRVDKEGMIKLQINPDSEKPVSIHEPWSYADNYRTAGCSIFGKYMYMENIFELGMVVLVQRINELRRKNELNRISNETIIKDIFAGFEHEYERWAFQINRGTFFPTIKSETSKYVKPVSSATKEWLLDMRRQKKMVFLCTSSNADYAKHILNNIFVDENGKPEDYWKYFDICLGDARKPHFFTNNNPFYSLKQDYPDNPVKHLESGRWYAQGNNTVLENYFYRKLELTGPSKPTICYFGDSLKSDVMNCSNVAKWSSVYLLEELLLDSKSLLDEEDFPYLGITGIWDDLPLSDTLLYSLAIKNASLVLPTLESISKYSLDYEFDKKLNY